MPIIPMKSASFSSSVTSGENMSLELVTGNNAEGKPSYALLLLPANRVKDLRIALSMKDVVLENYGKVLAKGEGNEPPADMLEDIKEMLADTE
jgi:hypothetical protein